MSLTCWKCGALAHSKCPWERTVFLEDQTAAMISNLLLLKEVREFSPGSEMKVVTIELLGVLSDRGLTKNLTSDEQALFAVLNNLRCLEQEQIVHAICSHEWEGICGFGHKHRRAS